MNLQSELIYAWCLRHVLALNIEWVKNPLTWTNTSGNLYGAYSRWMRGQQRWPVSENYFSGFLDELFPGQIRQGVIYGIRLFENGLNEIDPEIQSLYKNLKK